MKSPSHLMQPLPFSLKIAGGYIREQTLHISAPAVPALNTWLRSLRSSPLSDSRTIIPSLTQIRQRPYSSATISFKMAEEQTSRKTRGDKAANVPLPLYSLHCPWCYNW